MHTRFTFALAATAALALAACNNEPNQPDDRIVDTAEVDVNVPNVPVEYPEVAVNARTTVDYQGDYTQRLLNGRSRSIALSANDRFTIRDENGAESTGTFNWYRDNSRILIRRDGATEVYAIADGALYRMADENAPTAGPMTAEQTYRRVVGPGPAVGATGAARIDGQQVPAR